MYISHNDLTQWAAIRETSREVASAILSIANSASDADRIWGSPSGHEMACVVSRAWAAADDDTADKKKKSHLRNKAKAQQPKRQAKNIHVNDDFVLEGDDFDDMGGRRRGAGCGHSNAEGSTGGSEGCATAGALRGPARRLRLPLNGGASMEAPLVRPPRPAGMHRSARRRASGRRARAGRNRCA